MMEELRMRGLEILQEDGCLGMDDDQVSDNTIATWVRLRDHEAAAERLRDSGYGVTGKLGVIEAEAESRS